jgi:hypothetical protein
MNRLRLGLHMRIKGLARGLTRERADESTQAMIDRIIGSPASWPACLSSPAAWYSSSFGHDTPAHVERRCVCDSFYFAGSTQCGSERITLTGEWPWQRDDQEENQGETNRDLRPPIRFLHIGRCEGSCV